MPWRVPLADLAFGPEELEAVIEVIESRWLTMGSVTERFEKSFAEYLGVRHAIAVANGTVALHLAYASVGLRPGDEVILPSLTFVATANAVRYTGATPVFADITSASDFGLSPRAVEEAITPNTKAIAVMHYGGYMCDMPAILNIAQKYKLTVIEDAAHAPGSSLQKKPAGTWGHIGCFSFFSNKNLATGEGGMVVTQDDSLAEKIALMRSHGMTTLTWDRHRGHAHSYDVVALGYNYRIDEIRSALGLVQLEKLEKNNEKRREISALYREHLSKVDGLNLPYLDYSEVSAAHLFPVLLDKSLNRQAFITEMHTQGIQTSIHYPPIHQFTYYQSLGDMPTLPVTESVAGCEVTLPLYPGMEAEHVENVVEAVGVALEKSCE